MPKPTNPDILIEEILKRNPSHKPFIEESLQSIEPGIWTQLDSYIAFCTDRGVDISYLADCYCLIVADTFREQIYFMKHKKYRHSSYADVAQSVYHDSAYMEQYMYGLAITLFFWPAHRELKAFFLDTLPKDAAGMYLEIGPGHGFFFMRAMAESAYDEFLGVDISEKSIQMTRDILESRHFGHFSNFQLQCEDFLTLDFPGNSFAAVVMGEVLEHVEDPRRFLSRIRELSTPDSYIYISTCMNAPAVDHIALFTSVEHLEEIVRSAGLRTKDKCVVPYQGLNVQETAEKSLPMNIGLVLEHA